MEQLRQQQIRVNELSLEFERRRENFELTQSLGGVHSVLIQRRHQEMRDAWLAFRMASEFASQLACEL